MQTLMKNKPLLIAGLCVIVLCFTPLFVGEFVIFVMCLLLINMLWAASTWAIFHQTGQSLFAVAVIAGIGGYTSALLGQTIENAWITIALGLCASIITGMFFYAMASRIVGHIQFAALNLAFIFVFRYLLVAFTEFTKGIDGLTAKHFWPEEFFKSIDHRYILILLITAVSLLIIHKVMSSRLGRILTFIGRNQELAASVGINTRRYIKLSYLIFTPFIGLGGILFTHFVGHISPETWNADLSIIMIFASLIGGSANILGPIIGAIIATGIPISFDITAEFRFGIVGVLAILIFIFKPEGIAGWIQEIFTKRQKIAKRETT